MAETAEKISTSDFSEYYHYKIALCLENVYNLKYDIDEFPIKIFDLNRELHQIYIMIWARLSSIEKNVQNDFNKRLKIMKPIQYIKRQGPEGTVINVPGKTQDYSKFIDLCEEREIHIWGCLERLQLTSKMREKSKIVG